MGLDMYLFRCKKPEGIENGDLLSEEKYEKMQAGRTSFFEEKDYTRLCNTIRKNAVEVTSLCVFYDLTMITMKLCDKYKIDYDQELEDELTLIAQSDSERVFKTKGYEITIPEEEIAQYYYRKKELMYAVDMEEVAYQRKGLNDRGWELMACANCDYTDDFDAVKAMVDEGGLSSEFVNAWIDDETVFCPWW